MAAHPYVVLDAYSLGNAIIPVARVGEEPTSSEACRQWMEDCQAAGTTFLVPLPAEHWENIPPHG